MPTVRLAFSPAPQYVRTARLVSVAMARRAGVADELLDDVGLAVGDACGRAVTRHVRHGVDELVRVAMSDDGPYVVRVADACGQDRALAGGVGAGTIGRERAQRSGAPGQAAGISREMEDPADAEDADRMAEALLAGLVEDLEVRTGAAGREVRMAWPVRRRLIGGIRV